jgi:hypothetical protein
MHLRPQLLGIDFMHTSSRGEANACATFIVACGDYPTTCTITYPTRGSQLLSLPRFLHTTLPLLGSSIIILMIGNVFHGRIAR